MLPAGKLCCLRLVAALLAGDVAVVAVSELLHLHMLPLQHLQQLDLAIGLPPRQEESHTQQGLPAWAFRLERLLLA